MTQTQTPDVMLIQIQELIDKASSTDTDSGDYFSTADLSDRWCIGRDKVHRLLRIGLAAGIVHCKRIKRMRIDGVYSQVPCYRINEQTSDNT